MEPEYVNAARSEYVYFLVTEDAFSSDEWQFLMH